MIMVQATVCSFMIMLYKLMNKYPMEWEKRRITLIYKRYQWNKELLTRYKKEVNEEIL